MFLEELIEMFLASRKPQHAAVVSRRTIENYRLFLDDFVRIMGDCGRVTWEQITPRDFRAYIEHVNSNPTWVSPSTKLTALRSVRTLCKFVGSNLECRDEKLTDWSHLIGTVGPNERRKFIPAVKELRILRGVFNTNTIVGLRNYVVFSLIMGCGFRIGEICWLKLEHLQLEQGMIYSPPEGKTGSRLVPLDSKMTGLLKTWLKMRIKIKGANEVPWVFLGRGNRQCTRNTFGIALRKAQKGSTKGSRVTAHVLRHSFGTYYLRNGGNMERLRLIMGHTTYKTLQGYLHLAEVGSTQAKAEIEQVSPMKMLSGRS